jgi:Na+-transporting NADH:ubiquinone oxidoreductase subunit NqrB
MLKLPTDARYYQLIFLSLLLGVGAYYRDFSIQPAQVALTFAAGFATQAFFIRYMQLKNVGFLSAAITCFGLSLLLRANGLWVHPLAASAAIASKFLLRFHGKHLYNPANLGVMLALILVPGTWVSPGQWGNDVALAAWFVVLGSTVTRCARRLDISGCFLVSYLGLLAGRTGWLEQSWAIWLHQMNSGALLLFSFFMISDPMTIPNHRGARMVYAAVVASMAFAWQFYWFKPNGLVWALFLATPLVPLLDRLCPGEKTVWGGEERRAPLARAYNQ